ncbi:zinc finger protein 513-like [Polyodon spathula]|uniref:zinc finger protein 513-like n=1 Tax=Polyodon spathula TaxID=7913 RepID=UPI001B7F3B9B|nr:zinc finger protein 513-like [Polyodon spathula]
MPRRKQSNPQPVKLDSEDGLGVDNSGSLVLESDFLLGQDLEFVDSDDKIIGFEKDSEDAVAEIVIPVYSLSDDDCSSYNRLSMESDAEDPSYTESDQEENYHHTLQHYLSCKQCGQLLDNAIGGLGLSTPYCLKCGADSAVGGEPEEAHPAKKKSSSNQINRKVYPCKVCNFSSHYSNHLKRHMKTHNGEKPFKCLHCDYASAQLVNLQRHMRTHTGEKPFKCKYCAFVCNSMGNLKRHERMHTQDKPNKCNLCDYRASNSRILKRHMMGHEVEEPPLETEDAVVSDLTLHVNSSTDFLQSYASLKPEMDPHSLLDSRDVTEESETLPELLFPFTCRLCGLVLDDGFMHEDNSSSQICSKCGLEVLSQETPSSPEKTEKVFSCALCSFITHYPNHLARHMKTHSGEKPYKCPQCDYASAHFDNLKRHQRVHTGEKPYKCDLCDYACGNLANLKRHERVHSGAKPFKCSVCNYSCNQSMNLKRHMLRHTGEKPFKCQECPYTTGHWDNYKRHQKKHGHSTEGWTKLPQTETGDES